MSFTVQCVLTFFVIFVSDVFWVLCIRRVKEGAAHASAMWAVLLFFASSAGIIAYTENNWLLIPASLGCYLGTYLTVRFDKGGPK